MPSSRIVDRLSCRPFRFDLGTLESGVCANTFSVMKQLGYAWRPGVGVINALSDKCPTSYVILHG